MLEYFFIPQLKIVSWYNSYSNNSDENMAVLEGVLFLDKTPFLYILKVYYKSIIYMKWFTLPLYFLIFIYTGFPVTQVEL